MKKSKWKIMDKFTFFPRSGIPFCGRYLIFNFCLHDYPRFYQKEKIFNLVGEGL